MMNKKYLMRGFAALALVAGFSSCVKDVDGTSQKEIDDRSKENAEMQLGISIPDGQTWDMASQVEANVTVNGDYGAKYTVSIYENNPFINNTAVVLGKAETVSGGTATFDFTCPNHLYGAYAAIKDEKGYTYVKPVTIVDGKIETTFGGDAAAGARTMRSAKRSAADDFVIPVYSQPTVSQYLEGATEIDDQNCAGDIWDGPTCYSYKKLMMSSDWNKKIAALGNTNSNQGNFARTLYIKEGATWTVTSDQPTLGQGSVIVVAGEINIPSGVTLNTSGDPTYNCQIIVLPSGKITGAGKLSFNNGSLTGKYDYIGGTIDVGTINNNGGEVYIAGTMEADYIEGGAGKSIYINAGKVHIGNSIKGSSTANTRIYNNCWWECDGNIYCRNIRQGQGAYIKAANLGMSGSEDGTSDAAYIWAKENSLIEISGYVAFNGIDIVGPTGDGYAYLQFGEATGDNADKSSMSWYSNKLDGITMNLEGQKWVDGTQYFAHPIINNIRLSVDRPIVQDNMHTQTAYQTLLNALNGTRSCTTGLDPYRAEGTEHPEWATASTAPWTQQGNGNAVLVAKGQVNDVVTEDKCSPGISTVPPTPVYETLKVYTYAFEDQTVGTDYDMNDVVLKVNYHVTSVNSSNANEVVYDKTKLDVKLVAAGATYNIKVKIGDNYIFGGEEIHNLLKVNGVAVGAGVMVNTGNGKAVTAEPYEQTGIDIPSEWNGNFTTLPVTIEVTSTGKSYSYPNTDAYPHAVMIPVDWRWPTERTIITKAYPGTSDANKVAIGGNEKKKIEGAEYPENSFAAWAGTLAADRTPAMNGWYNHPNRGLTMTNTSPATND